MIEFEVTSLDKNSGVSDLWQGLNAASVALQQAAHSETAVYQVFSEQLIKLGLHGSVNLLDESKENLRVASIVFSERLMALVRHAESALKLKTLEFVYPADASLADATVLANGNIVFLPDNSKKMQQIIPAGIYRYAAPLLTPFLKIPAVLAPIYAQSEVIGVLYVAGTSLSTHDVPAMAMFATYLSIALENARLFQAVQQAEAQYRQLFESANDGIFLFDPDSRHLLSANPKMLSLLGIDETALGTIRPSNWATPQIYQQYQKHFETALKKGKHFFEVPFVDQSGHERQWQISVTVTELDGKSMLNGLVRDITEAKQAEQALRRREEQFRVLAENVPGTIYLCKNEPNFPLLYINDGIEALTGYPKEKFIRRDVIYSALIHPDDQAKAKQLLDSDQVQDGRKLHYKYRIRHRSGSWRWAEDVVGGVFDEQGNLLFLEGVVSDITERVQSDLLQKAVYNIATVAHTDISQGDLYLTIHEELKPILNVQNFYIALYDQEADVIRVPYYVNKYDTGDGPFEAGRGLTEYVVRQNSSQLLTHRELQFYIKQGIVELPEPVPQVWLGVPLKAQGKAIGALMVLSYEESTAYSEQDKRILTFVSEQIAGVIERKRAEEQQQQLSEKITRQTRLLEAILAATPDNFLVFDRDGRFQFISASVLNYLGVESDFVIGKTWQELQMPASFGKVSDDDRASVLRTGKPVAREFKFPLPDRELEIEFVTNPVLDSDGNVVSFVTTARDITERRQTMRAMHRAQKMESLGILAGGIAHDFNNLLVAMLGQASLAQAHLSETDPAYAHVSKAVHAAEQAANLTRQLLAYSGGGQFTIKPLQLNTLINESTDLLRVALPKQVSLQLELAPNLPLIEADVAQIQQVLMNLIINAAEAIGDQQGSIRIKTAVYALTDQDNHYWRYTNKILESGNYVKLSLQDSGSGMAGETIAKIFDPFFTTKFTGRGLGLAAVLGIVRSHNSGLHVTSEPNAGTVFELLFPIAETAIEDAIQEPSSPKKVDKPLILVIDDEQAVREAVVDILELEGIDALTAANGDQGIALYKERAADIDLILLDLSMPGKSGQETFAELQAFDPNVRIMLSSGYNEADATQGFASPPLVGFLQKPYRLDIFVQQLNKYL